VKAVKKVATEKVNKRGPSADLVDDALASVGHARPMATASVISTGLPGLDRALGGGVRPGETLLLASRPYGGHHEVAIAAALHAAIDLKVPTSILTATTGARDVTRRLLRARAGVESLAGRNERDRAAVRKAAAEIASAPLEIVDEPRPDAVVVTSLGHRDLLVVLGFERLMANFDDDDEGESPARTALRALERPLPDATPAVIAAMDVRDDAEAAGNLDFIELEVDDLRRVGVSEDDAAALALVGRELRGEPGHSHTYMNINVHAWGRPGEGIGASLDRRTGRVIA
jgi:hypothetical protein